MSLFMIISWSTVSNAFEKSTFTPWVCLPFRLGFLKTRSLYVKYFGVYIKRIAACKFVCSCCWCYYFFASPVRDVGIVNRYSRFSKFFSMVYQGGKFTNLARWWLTEKLPSIKSHNPLNMWSHDKLKIYLYYYNTYGHQSWQGAHIQ